ncbi:hypothetical protein Sjap_021969 [Stephania japonica]|uniref:Uncharacterized protein n=1 Tax=Stephania japonica TaxID=461633 RepID=A0AAP0ER39_9MAGN
MRNTPTRPLSFSHRAHLYLAPMIQPLYRLTPLNWRHNSLHLSLVALLLENLPTHLPPISSTTSMSRSLPSTLVCMPPHRGVMIMSSMHHIRPILQATLRVSHLLVVPRVDHNKTMSQLGPRDVEVMMTEARGVFFTVKTTKEFGTFLHPSSEVSKQMTRIYKFDLHKDGYCWDTVPNHIKEQYFNKWATHFDWRRSDDAMVRRLYDRQIATRYADFVSKMVRKPTKPAHVSLEVFEHYKKMRSTPNIKQSQNKRAEIGDQRWGTWFGFV